MTNCNIRVLVLGAGGMLGSTLFRYFSRIPNLDVFGSVRDAHIASYFAPELRASIISNIHLEGDTGLSTAFSFSKPDVVINCVGIVKKISSINDHIESLVVNSTLPHRLAKYCNATGARLVHFSTDCVFSGRKGMYKESDIPDAVDLYGRTKFLGEIDYSQCLTLRTSMIGHELNNTKSLVDWFLTQSCEVKGFSKAVFSGLPTIEIAHVLMNFIIPNNRLNGIYHLSVDPISKYDLLNLVAETYGKDIKIVADKELVIDRSLNSDRFRMTTGFQPRPWRDLIKLMHEEYISTI
jgi:dTDP-4-dehydrorhamnose reductase